MHNKLFCLKYTQLGALLIIMILDKGKNPLSFERETDTKGLLTL